MARTRTQPTPGDAVPAAQREGVYQGKSGAQIVSELLVRQHNVDVIFGYPGAAVLPVLDELAKTKIRPILNGHEQSAGHAADGYARASGRPGVAIVASGAATTNLVTPLATAHMDSVPMVVFTGQVPGACIGNDAFQQVDTAGITRPCTKYNCQVRDIRDLPRAVNEAFIIASSGRPGPVVVDLPRDVASAICPDEVDDAPRPHVAALKDQFARAGGVPQIEAAAELINASQRPVLYAGGGAIISGAWEVLRKLAAEGNIPCTTTLLGLGAFDESDPRALCMLGMHGSAFANYAVQECDCLIAIGARFDDRVTSNLASFAKKAKIVHIDVDPASISKLVAVDVPLVGDARVILEKMLPHIESRPREEWFAKIADWKKRHPFRYLDDSPLAKPQYVIEEIHRQTNGQAIIATGVGQHQMWTAQFFRWHRPRQLITSGGLGTMGYGLPAALGAAMGSGKPVIDIDGDGSLLMTCYELSTLAQHNIPVKVVLMRNTFLGMVKQWQDIFYQSRYSRTVLKDPNFVALAEAMGVRGIRCEAKANVPKTIETLLAHDGPILAEIAVEPHEHVYPMVGPGKGLHEMDWGKLSQLEF